MLITIVYIIAFWLLLPAVLVCTAVSLDSRVALALPDSGLLLACGIVISGISAICLSAAVVQFRRLGRTLPISATPPQVLINRGLFAIWRHPIYLFYTGLFSGIALIIHSASLLMIVLPVFTAALTVYILIEEHFLLKRFGGVYAYYRRSTALILPRLPQLLRIPLWILFKLMFNFKVVNKEFTRLSPPFFLVSSHRNYLDPFFIGIPIDLPVNYVTTYEMFRKEWLAFLFRKLRCLPKKRFLSDGETTRRIISVLRQGGVIGIFPEGERSWTGGIASFKPEVLKLLKKFNEIPILPVKISGNFHVWPRWSDSPRRSNVTVSYQKPFVITGAESLKQIEEQVIRTLKPDDDLHYCKSKRTAPGLNRVLYRCPVCSRFDTLALHQKDQLQCSICRTIYAVLPDYTIRYILEGSEKRETIEAIYRKIRVNSQDVRPGEARFGTTLQKINRADKPVLCSESRSSVYKLTESGTLKLLEGGCCLTTHQLTFSNNTSVVEIDLEAIRSVTVEANHKLQLFDGRKKQLYQILFVNNMCLKWQDLITLTIHENFDFQPNRQ